MARALATLVLTVLLLGSARAEESRSWSVPGLELPAPSKRAPGGYLKLEAKTEAVSVSWDVEAQLDGGAEFQWEILNPKVILLGIPAAPGIVRVTAVALADGKLTRFARTTIEIETTNGPAPVIPPVTPPAPGPRPVDPFNPSPAAGSAPAPKAPVQLHAYFLLDPQRDQPAHALAQAQALRDGLRAEGVQVHAFAPTSPTVATLGLTGPLQRAGGAPALVVVGDDEQVYLTARVPASADEVLTMLRRVKGER